MADNCPAASVPSQRTRWRGLLPLAAMIAASVSSAIVIASPAAAAPRAGCANTANNPYKIPEDMAGRGTPSTTSLTAPITSTGRYPKGWIGDPAPGWFSAWSPGALKPSAPSGGSLQVCADQRKHPTLIGVDALGTCAEPCTMHIKVTINGTRKAAVAIHAVYDYGYQTHWSMSIPGPHKTRGGWPVVIHASLTWAGGRFTPRSGLTYRSF